MGERPQRQDMVVASAEQTLFDAITAKTCDSAIPNPAPVSEDIQVLFPINRISPTC
jgi:hypothetical protein